MLFVRDPPRGGKYHCGKSGFVTYANEQREVRARGGKDTVARVKDVNRTRV